MAITEHGKLVIGLFTEDGQLVIGNFTDTGERILGAVAELSIKSTTTTRTDIVLPEPAPFLSAQQVNNYVQLDWQLFG